MTVKRRRNLKRFLKTPRTCSHHPYFVCIISHPHPSPFALACQYPLLRFYRRNHNNAKFVHPLIQQRTLDFICAKTQSLVDAFPTTKCRRVWRCTLIAPSLGKPTWIRKWGKRLHSGVRRQGSLVGCNSDIAPRGPRKTREQCKTEAPGSRIEFLPIVQSCFEFHWCALPH
jgi:hypothetical protein